MSCVTKQPDYHLLHSLNSNGVLLFSSCFAYIL